MVGSAVLPPFVQLTPAVTQAVLTKSALLRKKILSIVPAVLGQAEQSVKTSRA